MAKPNGISKIALIKHAKECSIAEVAGVRQGTIYYHFKTKEQLLLDIVQDICESSWTEVSQQNNQYIIKQAIESAKSRCA